ncbi:MAG: hypothetical protein IT311_06445 [Anaerolineales bacterium]|nr:hypothetical protein [Anaerolineales bacterium]MCZ2122237.1 hypothetical protein [Anaerolineales bacterium]
MIEAKRPVFFSGENPNIALFNPQTQERIAVASYWHCTDSPSGVGRVLILWLAETAPEINLGAVFTDNPQLARTLIENLTRHFPEFQEIPVHNLPLSKAQITHTYNGNEYQILCQTPNLKIEVEWKNPLDRKQIIWTGFPAGEAHYDLTTTICPCQNGTIKLNNQNLLGEIKVAQDENGIFSSSAFLAFAETWIGPLQK